MTDSHNEASLWRIELAGELASVYSSQPGVVMVCLGGSSARGVADAYSDLDIIVYWDEMDEDWIKNSPLSIPRTDLLSLSPGTFIESYHLEGLKVDFGHVKLAEWEEWIRPLHSDPSPEPELIGIAGGFLSSVVFHGEEEFARISRILADYPDSLAIHVIRKNMAFFVKGYLESQCYDRGDCMAYLDGTLVMLKRLLNITAALNRYYFYAGEVRWIKEHLKSMPLRPSGLSWESIVWILENPGQRAVSMINRFQHEILTLAEHQFPELSEVIENRRFRMDSLAVRPCESKPSVP